MSYWEWLFAWMNPEVWEVLSAFVAGLVILGAAALAIIVGPEIQLGKRPWLNWLFVPALLIVTYLLVALLAWSGTGAYA